MLTDLDIADLLIRIARLEVIPSQVVEDSGCMYFIEADGIEVCILNDAETLDYVSSARVISTGEAWDYHTADTEPLGMISEDDLDRLQDMIVYATNADRIFFHASHEAKERLLLLQQRGWPLSNDDQMRRFQEIYPPTAFS